MAYTLAPLRGGFDWPSVRALIAEAAGMQEGWPCWSFSNHDVERAATRWHPRGRRAGHDPDFVRLLMALLLSLRGSVCIYQGEELGLTEADLAFDGPARSVRHRLLARIPRPRRLPHAAAVGCRRSGGGLHHGRPPLAADPRGPSALAVNRSSVLADWRRFLARRSDEPALRRGSMRALDLPPPLVGFVREAEGRRILCVFNLSEEPAAFNGTMLPRFGVLITATA